MTPRQPSVPNLMSVIPMARSTPQVLSYQVRHFFLVQVFHNAAYILGALARSDQDRIGSFDNNKIIHANYGYKFFRSMHVITRGIERERLPGIDHVLCVVLTRRMVFIERGPRSQIIPAEVGAQAKQVG